VSTMLAFEDALATVLDQAIPGTRVIEIPVAESAGRVLAEEVRSDINMPPFNKSAMDGFAFRRGDSTDGELFRVMRTIAAGDSADPPLGPRECVRIMTGAPVPGDADTVIPVEDVGPAEMPQSEGEWVRFHTIPPRGEHIAIQGEDIRVGEVALAPNQVIRHQHVAVLASVGRAMIRVYAPPSIAFAATGEEIVEPGTPPRPGQIYNANASMLWSQILEARAVPHPLGQIRDTREDLQKKLAQGLEHDMLVVSGGVSMGQFDLVPDVLQELGVEILFHRLLIKPARPTLFGKRDRTLVFGLPGNPVSALYAFDQFVATAIRVFSHHPRPLATRYQGELMETVKKAPGRLLLMPCICESVGDRFQLNPIRTHGSADIFAIHRANALAILAAGVAEAKKGSLVSFRMLFE